jgi:hypothetical protein
MKSEKGVAGLNILLSVVTLLFVIMVGALRDTALDNGN